MSLEGKPSLLARGDPVGELPNWPNRSRRAVCVGEDAVDGRPLPVGLNFESKGEDCGVDSRVEVSCSSYGLFKRGTMMLGGAPEAYFGLGALRSVEGSSPLMPRPLVWPFTVPAWPFPLSFASVEACKEATGSPALLSSCGGQAVEGMVWAPDASASG